MFTDRMSVDETGMVSKLTKLDDFKRPWLLLAKGFKNGEDHNCIY